MVSINILVLVMSFSVTVKVVPLLFVTVIVKSIFDSTGLSKTVAAIMS